MRTMFMVITVFLISIFGITTPGFAQLRKDIGTCKGKIISVLYQSNEIVVVDQSTGANRTFKVSPQDLKALENNSEVIVIFKKETSDVAKSVKVIAKKPARSMVGNASKPASMPAKPAISNNIVPNAGASVTVSTVPGTQSSNTATTTKPTTTTTTTTVPSSNPKSSY